MRRFKNNGCVLWTKESLSNYLKLYYFTESLNNEFKYRNNKDICHASFLLMKQVFKKEDKLYLSKFFKNSNATFPYQSMSDTYKHQDFVYAYRRYYFYNKRYLLPQINWTKRYIPYWYNSFYFNQLNIVPN